LATPVTLVDLALPVLTVGTATSPTTCSGTDGTVAFTTANLPDGTYSLSFTTTGTTSPKNIAVSSNAFTLSGLSAGDYSNFSVTRTGCTGTIATMKTLVNPATPTLTAGTASNPTTCSGTEGNIPFTTTNLVNGTYSLVFTSTGTNGPQNVTVANNAFILSGLSAGNYSAFSITNNGCTGSDATLKALSNPTTPTISAGLVTAPTSCSAADGSIAFLSTNLPDGSYTITYTGTGAASKTITVASNAFALTGLDDGTYSNFSITNLGCTASDVTSKTVNNPIAPTLTAGTITNPSTCASSDGSIAFTTTLPNGTYTLNYTGAGNPQSITVVSGAFTLGSLPDGTFSGFSITNAGCTSNAATTKILTDPASPTLTAGIGTNPTTCASSDGSIAFTTTLPNGTYTLNYTGSGSPQTITVVSGAFTLGSLPDGTFSGFSVTTGGCTGIANTSKILSDPATATLTAGTPTNPSTCTGTNGSIAFTTTLPNGTYIMNYTGNNSPQNITVASGAFTLTGLTAGIYNGFSITNGGCTSVENTTKTLIDPTPPTAPTSPLATPATVCTSGTVALSASGCAGGTLTWYDAADNSVVSSTPTVSTNKSFYAKCTTNACASLKSANVNVTVTTLPTASISYVGSPFSKSASPVDVTLTGTSGGSFTSSPVGLMISTTTGQITPSSSTVGTYIVTYTISASGGCPSVTATTSVTIGNPFITKWKTDNAGTSNSTSVTIPTTGTGYLYDVDWNNDGTFEETGITGDAIHDYGTAGTYTIAIRGSFPRIFFNNNGDKRKLLSIEQWGDIVWSNMTRAFYGCSNMQLNATDTPNTASVTDMSYMFYDCSSFNQALPTNFNTATVKFMNSMFKGCSAYNQALPTNFNTVAVIDMSAMFQGCSAYNQALPINFNTAAVTDMSSMFRGCNAFNQALPANFNTAAVTNMNNMFFDCTAYNQVLPSSFNTAEVTDMIGMFNYCTAYNQELPINFNTAKVTNMHKMFEYCTAYNQVLPINFNTALVTDMSFMFRGCISFNKVLPSNFNTTEVTGMHGMFEECNAYNQALPINFNTAKVTNMANMFKRCYSFNQVLSNSFNTALVTDMGSMFNYCVAYNQVLPSSFNTAAVTNMYVMFQGCAAYNQVFPNSFNTSLITNLTKMFEGASSFNQDIGSWDVSKVTDMSNMLFGVTLSIPNYESLLIGWNAQALKSNVNFHGGSSKYCSATAVAAHQNMINSKSWTITDAGSAAPIATASSSTPIICAGNTISLTGSGIGSGTPPAYTWTGVNGFSSTDQNPSILNASILASGTYQITVTNVSGCTSTATTSVTVNSMPTATASSSTPTICAGNTIALTGGGIGSYTWTGVNGFTSTDQNPSIPNASILASGTYKITVTNLSGCTSTATTSVTVNLIPTITVATIPTIIAGATTFTIPYTATTGSPMTYSISGTGITTVTDAPLLSSPITVNLSAAASAIIPFTLTVKNANGCTSNTISGNVIVNTLITQTCATAIFTGAAPIAPTTTTQGIGGMGGLHIYTVPTGVTAIRLDARGAKGGTSPITGGGTHLGGNGGRVQATYTVTPGDVLYILVAGKGGDGSPDNGVNERTTSGGGGATVVSKGPIGTGTLLLVAGGGGGAGHSGSGGESNNFPGSGSGFIGAGGSSFSANGGNSVAGDNCGKGGQALNAGGNGGANTCFKPETNGGGYGGGSAGNYSIPHGSAGGGGGGGYVGGNGGGTSGGNGGSSYNDPSASNPVIGISSDNNGSVIITIPATISYAGSSFCKSLTTTGTPTTTGYTGGTFSSTAGLTIDATTGAINPSTSTAGTYTVTHNIPNSVGCTPVTTSVTVNVSPTTPTPNVVAPINLGSSVTLTATGCTGTLKWYKSSDNSLVTNPVSPSITTNYYAKCEVTSNGITCTSPASANVTVSVITVQIIYVNVSNTNPTQDGTTWATSFSKLNDGLTAAATIIGTPVEVWVAKGTYKPTTTTNRIISFNLPSGVKMYGGFVGTETILSQRNFRTNETLLSGDIGTKNIHTDNTYHIIQIIDDNNQTAVDGFSIKYGYAANQPPVSSVQSPNNLSSSPLNPMTPQENGGAIFIQNSSPSILNCTIQTNVALFGAGIYAETNSVLTIAFCNISGNFATFGGGIYYLNSGGTVNNTLITGNKGLGGGIYNNHSSPSLNNVTVANNSGFIGGIYNTPTGVESRPVINNAIIWGNTIGPNPLAIITNSIVEGGYTGIGNLNYDPQFVAPEPAGIAPTINGNYHLKPSSLAIDRGDNGSISLTDTDLDGNLRRYIGGRVDMGAYEFQGVATANLVISVVTGPWEANSTWDVGHVPQLGDYVIIDSNHTVTLNGEGTAKNVESRSNSVLKFGKTNAKLNIGF
jgi:surface protein